MARRRAVRTMTRERNAVASKSAGACTGRTGCRNINGERRTIPQLVSTLSRQNQCDLNLLHPLQHPLDRSTSPRACLPACHCQPLPGLCVPLSFELPLHVEFHYRKQSAAAPLSMECVLSSPTMDTSCYFFFLFFFFFFSFYFGDFVCFPSPPLSFRLFVLSLFFLFFFLFFWRGGRVGGGRRCFLIRAGWWLSHSCTRRRCRFLFVARGGGMEPDGNAISDHHVKNVDDFCDGARNVY